MTRRSARHAIWYLVLRNAYAYGDYVSDPLAFALRARTILKGSDR